MASPIKSIVLADDDYDDIEIFKEAFAAVCPDVSLNIVRDGKALLNFLKEIPTPDAILLDINMPFKSGKECLKEIRQEEKFKNVPIIILSTSNVKSEINYCLNNGATEYYIKPPSYIGIKGIVEEICAGRFNKKVF